MKTFKELLSMLRSKLRRFPRSTVPPEQAQDNEEDWEEYGLWCEGKLK